MQQGWRLDNQGERERNPVRKHQIQPGYGDEQQGDAGRDCRTRVAKKTFRDAFGDFVWLMDSTSDSLLGTFVYI